jgi:tRNA(fMet)-specific endonuclease VapC
VPYGQSRDGMKYLLDTNTIVRYLNGRAPNVRISMRTTPTGELAVSAVVVAELRYSAAKRINPPKAMAVQDQFLSLIGFVPFDQPAADAYGTTRAMLEKQGTPIGAIDLLIGATALAHQLILVTHNTREFGRIPGLSIEDWE